PAGIIEVNAVGGFVILMLQGGEKLVDGVLFGPVAVEPSKCGQNDHGQDGKGNRNLAPSRLGRVVEWGVEQGHKSLLSIADLQTIKVGERTVAGNGLRPSTGLKHRVELPMYKKSVRNDGRGFVACGFCGLTFVA